jgi:hypothetical protein
MNREGAQQMQEAMRDLLLPKRSPGFQDSAQPARLAQSVVQLLPVKLLWRDPMIAYCGV